LQNTRSISTASTHRQIVGQRRPTGCSASARPSSWMLDPMTSSIGCHSLQRHVAGVQPGHVEQVADQAGHALGLFADRLGGLRAVSPSGGLLTASESARPTRAVKGVRRSRQCRRIVASAPR
jgi:hypothetical protein